MRIKVGNFTTDMNDLLNQLNSKNNLSNADAIIKKAWDDTKQKFDQANENINNVYAQYHHDLQNSEKTMNESFSNKLKDKSDEFLNRLLAQENNFKDFQDKDTAQKLKLAQKIDTAHDNIVDFVNGQHFETPEQLNKNYDKLWGNITFRGRTINGPKDMANAIWDEDGYIAKQMKAKTDAENQFAKDEIDMTMAGPVRKQFDDMRTQFPHNFMEYMPSGQFPPTAQTGDICWQASDYGFNTNAKAFQYDGSSWKPLKTQLNLYASNIYSPNINGGVITGAQFLSEYHGRDGKAYFSVDHNGDIYAHDLSMDLDTDTTGSGLNGYTYNADNDDAKGLSFNGGVMSMKAIANQTSGTFVRGYNGAIGGYNDADYQGDFNAQTYIQPDYLKLRAGTLGDGTLQTVNKNGDPDEVGALLARTDLRAGNLELSDQWGQNYGVRLGYWNEDTSNNHNKAYDVGPLLAIENGVTLGYKDNDNNPEFDLADWNMHESGKGKLWIQPNDDQTRELDLKAPVNIHGTLTADGDTLVKSSDYGAEQSALNSDYNIASSELSHHNEWLQNHEQLLSVGGYGMPTFNGSKSRLDLHNDHLSEHDDHLSKHDGDIQDLYNKLANTVQFSSNDAGQNALRLDTLYVSNASIAQDGQISCPDLYAWNNITTDNSLNIGSTPITISGDGNSLDVGGSLLATYEWVANNFKRSSRLGIKRDVHDVDPKRALSEVLNTDIKAWNYKSDKPTEKVHYGPIIDNIHSKDDEKYYVPHQLLTTDKDTGIDVADSVSFLFLSIQELEKQNSQLTQRVAKLELDNK